MRTILLAGVLLLSSGLFARCSAKPGSAAGAADPQTEHKVSDADNTRVQVALLLDTSNSMDGLIDQAKSRLWNIVNTLTTLKYKGKAPVVEIALYEYGNDGLPAEENYIRQVTPLTSDLDLISEKLFALRTNGGNEYCGAVIGQAVKKLRWSGRAADMKLIYIAGNEPFNQGSISYKEMISDAITRDIYVNTIFCGNREEGIDTWWKDGAEKGKGKYFNIDPDRKVRFVETPYDKRIEACNEKMNRTYIGYGAAGAARKSSQAQQDANARTLSAANYTERAVSKSKAMYKNAEWDIVDKVKDDKRALDKLSQEEMPQELKGKSKAEAATIIAAKAKERDELQKEIAALGKERQAYIDKALEKESGEDDLGAAINNTILELARTKGYVAAQ
ncbi:vWA domain-containing protein [Taibaiella koreensis]|uniref:vWA domain-containing protein n=1 Tax=Taibaiella koreensis TaxID=1268548 RepID=UPI000E59D72F|nr:VWA domain-containing protein [Taibaiella koreensis]